MNSTSACVAIAFALTAFLPPAAQSAEAPSRAARFFYRDDYPTNSSRMKITLENVSTYYTDASNYAENGDDHKCPNALNFAIVIRQPTQETHWISIPLSTMATVDFQWLPLPRSTIGFKHLLIAAKNGGSHAIEMLVDGQEYRYVCKNKAGVVEREITGGLELRLKPTTPAAPPGADVAEAVFDWFAFRGVGQVKQRPHSPDMDWIINREFIDRIEFVVSKPAGKPIDPPQ